MPERYRCFIGRTVCTDAKICTALYQVIRRLGQSRCRSYYLMSPTCPAATKDSEPNHQNTSTPRTSGMLHGKTTPDLPPLPPAEKGSCRGSSGRQLAAGYGGFKTLSTILSTPTHRKPHTKPLFAARKRNTTHSAGTAGEHRIRHLRKMSDRK